MGVAIFIVAEREVEGLDLSVDGKALARCKYLEGLAREVGVRPLMEFFSMSDEEAASLLGNDDDDDDDEETDPETPATNLPPERWFEAEEGLMTVRGLLKRLEQGPVDLPGMMR